MPQTPTPISILRTVSLQGSGGIGLAADIGGDPRAVPIVLLHGGGQTRQSWSRTASALAAGGYHVVSYDARGHGDSGWSETGDYSAEAFVDDLRCVVATLSGPPVLIGASMGGMTSMVAVGSRGMPARALVLVDVAVKLETTGVGRILAFMAQGQQDGYASLDEAAEAVARYNPHRKARRNPEGLRKNLRQRSDGRWVWHWDPRYLTSANRYRNEALVHEEHRADAARGVRIPTLLVRGERSDVLTAEGARALLELIPHAELADVTEAGHMVVGDCNDAFGATVDDFLRRNLR